MFVRSLQRCCKVYCRPSAGIYTNMNGLDKAKYDVSQGHDE